jgi:hypothetical protein
MQKMPRPIRAYYGQHADIIGSNLDWQISDDNEV